MHRIRPDVPKADIKSNESRCKDIKTDSTRIRTTNIIQDRPYSLLYIVVGVNTTHGPERTQQSCCGASAWKLGYGKLLSVVKWGGSIVRPNTTMSVLPVTMWTNPRRQGGCQCGCQCGYGCACTGPSRTKPPQC